MATAARQYATTQGANSRPVRTRIASKWQMTVPPEVRSLFALEEGDFFEWKFDPQTQRLYLVPQRTQMLTAQVKESLVQRVAAK